MACSGDPVAMAYVLGALMHKLYHSFTYNARNLYRYGKNPFTNVLNRD